jgi:hypothetical protein
MKRIKSNITRKIALMVSLALPLMFASAGSIASAQTPYAPVGPMAPVGSVAPYGIGYAGSELGIGSGYGWDGFGFYRGNSGPIMISAPGVPGGLVPYCPFHERFEDGWCRGGDKGKYDFWGNERD